MKWVRWLDSLNACMVTIWDELNGYRMLQKKGSNGGLSTIPILNVFGRLERRSREGKGKGEIRSEEKTESGPIMLSLDTQKKVAGGCVKITGSTTPREGQIKIIRMDSELHQQSLKNNETVSGGNSGAAWDQQQPGSVYLSEAVRLGGAQRLIGQLQQLLGTLQGFGAGAQLTLRKNTGKQSHVWRLSHIHPRYSDATEFLWRRVTARSSGCPVFTLTSKQSMVF